jgi:hypothetical protein
MLWFQAATADLALLNAQTRSGANQAHLVGTSGFSLGKKVAGA